MAFEDLKVWQRSVALSANVIKGAERIASFGFRDQLIRSSLSIPSNIAEGMERGSSNETRQFLSYSLGSSGELRTQILVGVRAGLIEETLGRRWIEESQEISAMIRGLQKKLLS